jgi:hypothetical protein
MPKKMYRNKRGSSRLRTRTPPRAARTHSVKDLLTRNAGLLTQVTQRATRQNLWEKWLAARLPAELAAQICGVAGDEGTLVVFAISAAWSARLRYALAELEPQMREHDAALRTLRVRVRPRQ